MKRNKSNGCSKYLKSRLPFIGCLSIMISVANSQVNPAESEKRQLGDVITQVSQPDLAREAINRIQSEVGSRIQSFEIRGLNFGSDYRESMLARNLLKPDDGVDMGGFQDVRKEVSTTGSDLYFYHGVLFMAWHKDIQDPTEIRAVMTRLEEKFNGKFEKFPEERSVAGNLETTTGGFFMKIGSDGQVKIRIPYVQPADRNKCIDDIANEMKRNIQRGQRNYLSLTDRVDIECKGRILPTNIVITHQKIEQLVNARSRSERLAKERQLEIEKNKTAKEKASSF